MLKKSRGRAIAPHDCKSEQKNGSGHEMESLDCVAPVFGQSVKLHPRSITVLNHGRLLRGRKLSQDKGK